MGFFDFTFIMFVGAAIASVGLVMLIFAAFTTSAAWGIASVVVPPLAIAFAVTHFSKARNGFAILMIGAVIFGYGSWDKSQQDRAEQAQMEAEAQQESESVEPEPEKPVDTPATTTESTKTPAAASPSSTLPPPKTTTGETRAPVINIIDIHKYIGKRIRVTTSNGAVRTGILLEAASEGIVMNFRPKGVDTLIKANINENEIELIELLSD